MTAIRGPLGDVPEVLRKQVEGVLATAGRGGAVVLPEMEGGSRGLMLHLLAASTNSPMLVLAGDEKRAAEIARSYAFFAGDAARRVAHFPAYDVSPYESVSPGHRIVHRRLDCLQRLLFHSSETLAVATAEAICHRIVPRSFLADHRRELEVGQEVDRDALARELVTWGYNKAGLTEDVGDFSVRGSLVDLFPPTATHPVRLDLMGDVIERMRAFHPENQRTREEVERITLLPCREIVLSEANAQRFTREIKDLADAFSLPKSRRDAMVGDVAAGIYFPGIEFLLPLFYGAADTLMDCLGPGAIVVIDEWTEVARRAERFTERVRERYQRCLELGKIAVEPERRYLAAGELAGLLRPLARVYLGVGDPLDEPEARALPVRAEAIRGLKEEVLGQEASARMLEPVATRIRRWTREEGGKALVVCRGPSGLARMRALLADHDLLLETDDQSAFPEFLAASLHATGTVTLLDGDPGAGFAWRDLGLLLLTEEDLFGEKRRRIDRPRVKASQVIASFGDLRAGDFIVHLQHGVGIYRGLEHLEIGGIAGEYLLIEYAGKDKLYLPVDRLSLVQRYVGGEGGAPSLDRLGNGGWERVKARAKASARAMAKELLALYAARAARPGFAFSGPDNLFREFEATFPFEETPDQAEAISEALADMQRPRPMDRLVCGDVGFGKTEVALRAIFLAVLGGKQAAVLVPTTTLAFQHFRTFRSRLEVFGVKLAMLSRFVDAARRKRTLEALAAGEIDVIVGTHQLLGQAVSFADLGLLVIDEEQHFGVAQKEKIKRWRSAVDVLILTATPIPRTFHMSLSGIRDLSIINTPPEDRLAVRTFVTRYDEDTIREAARREIERGGQIFFIHNRIRTIGSMAERLSRLVPGARMTVAHGQMKKDRLERTMIDFAEQKINFLVCTAIIESGLDFPMANTIFIDRADAFGLAQVYQLRGRVGRSERRAYAYLLVPAEKAITADARKRLAVLRNFTELGSGFRIAAHDLEIRGAGNVLGTEQSGHIHEVGYEMYQKLLEEAIAELRGQEAEEVFETEVNLRLPAYIPRELVPDEHVRLTFYKRLSEAGRPEQAEALREEMADRFGEIPIPLENLFRVQEVKQLAASLYVQSLDRGTHGLVLRFDDRTPVAPADIVVRVAREPERFRLDPEGRLIVRLTEPEQADVVAAVKKLLQELA